MTQDGTAKSNRIGRVSLWLALSPWIAYVLVLACAIAGMPGFG